jgi:hypothetical protein
VFSALVMAFVGFVVMFAAAVAALVTFVTRSVPMMALVAVIRVTHRRTERLGGSRLGRGDIPSVSQRSGAEEGNEDAEHDCLAHGGFSWLASRPPIRPATGGTIGEHC